MHAVILVQNRIICILGIAKNSHEHIVKLGARLSNFMKRMKTVKRLTWSSCNNDACKMIGDITKHYCVAGGTNQYKKIHFLYYLCNEPKNYLPLLQIFAIVSSTLIARAWANAMISFLKACAPSSRMLRENVISLFIYYNLAGFPFLQIPAHRQLKKPSNRC